MAVKAAIDNMKTSHETTVGAPANATAMIAATVRRHPAVCFAVQLVVNVPPVALLIAVPKCSGVEMIERDRHRASDRFVLPCYATRNDLRPSRQAESFQRPLYVTRSPERTQNRKILS
jgi:hypothetical protein